MPGKKQEGERIVLDSYTIGRVQKLTNKKPEEICDIFGITRDHFLDILLKETTDCPEITNKQWELITTGRIDEIKRVNLDSVPSNENITPRVSQNIENNLFIKNFYDLSRKELYKPMSHQGKINAFRKDFTEIKEKCITVPIKQVYLSKIYGLHNKFYMPILDELGIPRRHRPNKEKPLIEKKPEQKIKELTEKDEIVYLKNRLAKLEEIVNKLEIPKRTSNFLKLRRLPKHKEVEVQIHPPVEIIIKTDTTEDEKWPIKECFDLFKDALANNILFSEITKYVKDIPMSRLIYIVNHEDKKNGGWANYMQNEKPKIDLFHKFKDYYPDLAKRMFNNSSIREIIKLLNKDDTNNVNKAKFYAIIRSRQFNNWIVNSEYKDSNIDTINYHRRQLKKVFDVSQKKERHYKKEFSTDDLDNIATMLIDKKNNRYIAKQVHCSTDELDDTYLNNIYLKEKMKDNSNILLKHLKPSTRHKLVVNYFEILKKENRQLLRTFRELSKQFCVDPNKISRIAKLIGVKSSQEEIEVPKTPKFKRGPNKIKTRVIIETKSEEAKLPIQIEPILHDLKIAYDKSPNSQESILKTVNKIKEQLTLEQQEIVDKMFATKIYETVSDEVSEADIKRLEEENMSKTKWEKTQNMSDKNLTKIVDATVGENNSVYPVQQQKPMTKDSIYHLMTGAHGVSCGKLPIIHEVMPHTIVPESEHDQFMADLAIKVKNQQKQADEKLKSKNIKKISNQKPELSFIEQDAKRMHVAQQNIIKLKEKILVIQNKLKTGNFSAKENISPQSLSFARDQYEHNKSEYINASIDHIKALILSTVGNESEDANFKIEMYINKLNHEISQQSEEIKRIFISKISLYQNEVFPKMQELVEAIIKSEDSVYIDALNDELTSIKGLNSKDIEMIEKTIQGLELV